MFRKTLTAIAILAVSSSLFARAPENKYNTFGIGLGIPYGILGANVDVNVAPRLYFSAGIGTTVLAGVGYNVGFKYFMAPPERKFRPRISAYYGTNAAIEFVGGSEDDNKSYTGISLGFGGQWMWGRSRRNGLDLDIMYLATSGYDLDELRDEGYDIEEPGKVRLSIGWRHAF